MGQRKGFWIGLVVAAAIWPLHGSLEAQGGTSPTYVADVAPILQRQCVECHRDGGIAPFSLQEFDEVRRRARAIADVTTRRYMPPWTPVGGGPFQNARGLTEAEIGTIATPSRTTISAPCFRRSAGATKPSNTSGARSHWIPRIRRHRATSTR